VQATFKPKYRNQNRFALRYWPTYPGLLLIWLLAWLPLPALRIIGTGLGLLVFHLFSSRRRIALTNVSLCFPELTCNQQLKMVRQHFIELGTSVICTGLNWHASIQRLHRLFEIQGQQFLEDALSKKQNIILLAPHFVSLEIGGIYISELYPSVSMYQFAKNKAMDLAIRRGRSRFGIELVERTAPMRNLIRKIRKGKLFYYLPDQDPGPMTGVFVPFFNNPVSTFPMLGRFASLTNSVVIPCMTTQKARGKGYKLEFFTPIENFPVSNELLDTARMNQAIEELIKISPEQYFWVHKRFKSRPAGQPSVY
jgi:KDO2-lipid IV(A) lauroyltransferase